MDEYRFRSKLLREVRLARIWALLAALVVAADLAAIFLIAQAEAAKQISAGDRTWMATLTGVIAAVLVTACLHERSEAKRRARDWWDLRPWGDR
jgi:peptidoglycan/LPS O-acetylase OafA/YrhL